MTSTARRKPAKRYALRFISGKYQGEEVPLPESGEIVIGRANELDIVLVEDMVSRRHAKVLVADDQVILEDLASTNGSFVNGEKIERAVLAEGDRILVGTSIFKLVISERSNEESAEPPSPMMIEGKRTTQVRTMTGSISEVPLPDLIQLFAGSKKSGVLVVRTPEQVGKIFLKEGAVVYATVDDDEELAPLKAMLRIVSWKDGVFEMEPPEEREFRRPLKMGTEGLLMEVMRQTDEMRRLGPDMPPANAVLEISSPLRNLSSQELDVLQLAHNYRQVEAILKKSLASDPETGLILVKLIRGDYLKTL